MKIKIQEQHLYWVTYIVLLHVASPKITTGNISLHIWCVTLRWDKLKYLNPFIVGAKFCTESCPLVYDKSNLTVWHRCQRDVWLRMKAHHLALATGCFAPQQITVRHFYSCNKQTEIETRAYTAYKNFNNYILYEMWILLSIHKAQIVELIARQKFYQLIKHFGPKILTELIKASDSKSGGTHFPGHIFVLQVNQLLTSSVA